MVVHIFPVEKFTNPYISFINKNFPKNDHFFYLYGDYKNDYIRKDDIGNVKVYGRKRELFFDISFRKDLRNATSIIVHNFNELPVGIFITQPQIKRKSAVVFWGGDIYIHRLVLEGTDSYLVRIVEIFKKIALKGIPLFLTFCHDDYLMAKEWYRINGKSIDILYPSTVDKKSIEKIYKNKETHSGTNILLGNSATSSNQHFEAFELLRKFSDDEINVFVPLAYGNMDYRDEVIAYGRAIFGDKLHPITRFMSPNEYADFIGKMDIAIFNNDRQQATGNIEIAAYLGAKVYLRPETVMWDHYVRRDGRKFFPTSDIGNETIESMLKYKTEDFNDNHKYFSNIWDEKYLCSIWDNVFSVLGDLG